MIKQFYHTSDWQLLIQLLESSLCFSADGKLVLAANGEIYNHRDLRSLQVNIASNRK
jgi:asparagine synthetase B (glutamine-hydrolysing)